MNFICQKREANYLNGKKKNLSMIIFHFLYFFTAQNNKDRDFKLKQFHKCDFLIDKIKNLGIDT